MAHRPTYEELEQRIERIEKAEKDLQRSESLLNATQRIAKVGGWEWNVEDQTMYWTSELYRLHGFHQDEFTPGSMKHIEQSIECYEPEDRIVIQEAFKNCIEHGEAYDLEFLFHTIKRQPRWIRTIAEPIRENGTVVKVIGNIVDITDHKQAEEELRESEGRLREAEEMALLGHYVFDINKDRWTSSIQLNDIFGIDKSYKKEIASWLKIIHPDHRVMVSNYLQASILTEHQSFDFEYKVIDQKTGCEKWVHGLGELKFDKNNNPVELFGTIQDITERKLSEEALREAKAILQAAMDNSQAAIAIADAPNGTLRYVNKAGLLIRGGTEDELVKDVGIDKYVSIWQMRHSDGTVYKTEDVPLARAIMYGETCSDEIILKRPDGEERFVLANASPIYDDEGNVIFGVVVFIDITEQKKLEKELIKFKKIEATAALASGIAHDFNNLLAVIVGYIELALDDLGMNHRNADDLKESLNACMQAQNLTSKFITFSSGKTSVKRKSSIKELLTNSVAASLPSADYKAEFSFGENLWQIEMDTGQMSQVFDNVLLNASESLKKGGRVQIRAENISTLFNEGVVAEAVADGPFVKITITDQGEGISSKVMQNIYDPYFSTKERGIQKGMGLGLTVALSIVKQHGGHLVIKSKENIETSVYIYLPASA